MSDASEPCPQCGAPFAPGTRFCGQCGYDLVNRPPVGKPAQQKTMLGMASSPMSKDGGFAPAPPMSEPPDADQAAPAAPSKKAVARTMMGMPAVPPGAAQPAQAAASASPQAPARPPEPAPSPAQPPQAAPQPTPAQSGKNRTMLGMPMVPGAGAGAAPTMETPAQVAATQPPSQAAREAPAQAAAETPAQAPASTEPAPVSKPSPTTNRTMLGMVAPPEVQQAAQEVTAPPGGGAPPPTTNRTMLGVAVAPPAAQQPQAQPQAPQAQPTFDDDWGSPAPTKTKSRTPWFVGAVVLLLLGGGGIAAALLLGGGPDVRASVVHGEGGEQLQVDVPGAPAGTKVRFDGVEQTLEAGRAVFPLQSNDLQLGDNEFVVDVVSAEGKTEQATLILSVPYRVRADLSGLDSDPPALRIVVDAHPGAEVTLDEQPLALDATGHGTLDLPLDPSGDAPVFERTVQYRVVTADGEISTGEVPTRIPYATLQIDRPGARSLTDHEQLSVVGAAHAEARVTIDGSPVTLTDQGTFATEIDVPMGESQIEVVAHQPGRVPRSRTLNVRRVEDLAAEAASYEVDRSLTYARISTNPESFRGQRAAFVGRVYNVNVDDGRSVLQLVVRECPRGQRCPLWVTYDGATDAELNSWVRVVGELSGEQQYRTRNDQRQSDPRLDAAFVLPADGR